MTRIYSGRDCGKIIEPLLMNARYRVWVVTPFISKEYAKLLIAKAREGIDVKIVTCSLPENRGALDMLYSALSMKNLGSFPEKLGPRILILGITALLLYVVSLQLYPYGGGIPSYVIAAISYILMLVNSIILALRDWRIWLTALAIPVLLLYVSSQSIDFKNYLSMHLIVATLVSIAVASIDTVSMRLYVGQRYTPRLQVKVVDRSRIIHSKIYIADSVGIVGSPNLTRAGLWRNYETITLYEGDEVREVERVFLELWHSV